MSTPLDQYASLTVAYQVPTAINEDTIATDEIVAIAWVNLGGANQRPEESNVFTDLPLKGYFLKPQVPSAAIRPGVSAPAILWRLGPSFTLLSGGSLRSWKSHADYYGWVEKNRQHIDHDGTFTLAATLASPYTLPDQLLGKKLQGVFSYRTTWGDVV